MTNTGKVMPRRPLYFVCPVCSAKQSAGLHADENLYADRVEHGSSEEHLCRGCGTLTLFKWGDFTFDGSGSVMFVPGVPEGGENGGG